MTKMLFQKDKRDHVVYSYAICLCLSSLLMSLGWAGLCFSATLTTFVGLMKEIIDKLDSNVNSKPDAHDFIADLVGVVLACCTWYVAFLTTLK